MEAPRYEVYEDTAGEWRWRLIAANGSDIIAVPGEGYSSKQNCLKGIASVQGNSDAPVVEL